MRVAVMGCVVNGPGEAKEADIGVAFGKNEGLLFKNGKPIRKISQKDCVKELLKELKHALV
jgi:(E)-4-hydroxy-3-methylbut-2-enyl-diphosphate synthase